ncbi:MAG: hypothetical protein K0R43_2625 [Pseudoduganella sp.]|jgi:hypothetical protein|nr:hypothetical protein [Pseudoduganella sp.]
MHKTRGTRVPSRPLAHAALIALLATALLLAMAAGLRHRITHAWPATADAAAPDPAPAHSCLAYDAATLAEPLPAALRAPPRPAAQARACACPAPLSRALSAPAHCRARGPPAAALP